MMVRLRNRRYHFIIDVKRQLQRKNGHVNIRFDRYISMINFISLTAHFWMMFHSPFRSSLLAAILAWGRYGWNQISSRCFQSVRCRYIAHQILRSLLVTLQRSWWYSWCKVHQKRKERIRRNSIWDSWCWDDDLHEIRKNDRKIV